MDFIFDRTADGRLIKMLVVLDEYTRENIALEVSRKLKSHDVIMVLDELTAKRSRTGSLKFSTPARATSCCRAKFYDTRGSAIALCKMAFGLQPSTTTARAGQANTGGIRGQVRGTCGAKVGATDGNDGKYKKVGTDYEGPYPEWLSIWSESYLGHCHL